MQAADMVVGKEGNADDLSATSAPSWSDKGKALHPTRFVARRQSGVDAVQGAREDGGLKRRLEQVPEDRGGIAGWPSSGDRLHHGVCLGEDEPKACETGNGVVCL